MDKNRGYTNQNAILVEKQKEMAKLYNIQLSDIQDICNLPFGLLKEVLESNRPLDNYFPSMKIPGFMTWHVNDAKQYFLKKKFEYYEEKKLEVLNKEEEVIDE